MTNREALKILGDIQLCFTERKRVFFGAKRMEAFNMAVEILEEQIKLEDNAENFAESGGYSMTNDQAIRVLEDGAEELSYEDMEWYDVVGRFAFKKAIKALRKQIPRKPIKCDEPNCCPTCASNNLGHPVGYQLGGIWETYCLRCGQKIDWE